MKLTTNVVWNYGSSVGKVSGLNGGGILCTTIPVCFHGVQRESFALHV